MTSVPSHILVTHSLRPASSCSEVLPLYMTWHTHKAFKCTFCRRQVSGSAGCAPTFPPCSVHICQKPDHPSQTRQDQLLKANPKWQNWRQMKEHTDRTTYNAVQTNKKQTSKGKKKIKLQARKIKIWNFKTIPSLGMEGSNNGNHNVPISAFTDMYHFSTTF